MLALPRGGVPVAYEVARSLHAPLDVFLVRKLGLPGYPELAMGAIASGGLRILNDDIVAWQHIAPDVIDRVAAEEQAELERRERAYRGGAPPMALRDRVVVLVDDGLATGASMRAAVGAVRQQQPARVVVAVPVGSPDTCRELAASVDEVVCARMPQQFSAVGKWYRDFSQTSDAEVRELLERAAQPPQRRDDPTGI